MTTYWHDLASLGFGAILTAATGSGGKVGIRWNSDAGWWQFVDTETGVSLGAVPDVGINTALDMAWNLSITGRDHRTKVTYPKVANITDYLYQK